MKTTGYDVTREIKDFKTHNKIYSSVNNARKF